MKIEVCINGLIDKKRRPLKKGDIVDRSRFAMSDKSLESRYKMGWLKKVEEAEKNGHPVFTVTPPASTTITITEEPDEKEPDEELPEESSPEESSLPPQPLRDGMTIDEYWADAPTIWGKPRSRACPVDGCPQTFSAKTALFEHYHEE